MAKENIPVKVGAKIGVTINLGDYNSIKCEFWHERVAKNDSIAELKRASALVDEFNEEALQRYVRKYKRLVESTSVDSASDPNGPRQRAKRRMKS